MKKFILGAAALTLMLTAGCGPEQIQQPQEGGKQAVEEKPVEEDSTARDARLARLGITPVRCVYLTEYTESSQWPTLEDIKCFTHVNYGHARFVDKKNGTGLEVAKPENLTKLAAFKKDYPELKILLMVGGWGYNADGFSEMAKDDAKRKAFCENILKVCEDYGIDGVDLDWEYPTHAAHSTHNGEDYYNGADPSDTKNFTTLVKELRETLGENRLITYAASSSGDYMDHKAALDYVDYINVMTYSMGDPPYHNSPLYRSELTRKRSGQESIETFFSKGVPYDRMNYGVGFYGHGDGSVYPSSVQYHRAVDALSTGKVDGKSVEGYNIRWWDDQGKNCYLGDKDGKMYASYEDPESIGYRVAFLKQKGMLGAFAWEYREDDAKGTLRKALRDLMAGKTVDNPYPGNGPATPTEPEPEPEELYPAETDTPSAPTGPFVDLGANGTANCYVVTAPGQYKFKAVKGCGTTSVGTVKQVRLLWETCNTTEAPERFSVIESYGVDNGYITFKTPDTLKPGNALRAAFNSYGELIWSWHIWIPETQFTEDTYGLSAYAFMSRNLGALIDAEASSSAVDIRANGLHYQWGRKDPFPTPDGSGKMGVAGKAMSLSGGKLTTAEAIAKPTVFGNVNGDWASATNGDYWGDNSTGKSVYDPCPPGYKVPKREDATAIFKTNLVGVSSFVYNSDAHWFKVGNPVAVFPLPGYIDYTGSMAGAGKRTDIWNAHADKDSPGNAYGQYIYEGPTSKYSAQTKARGGSVRCVSLEKVPFDNAPGMPVQGKYTRKVFDSGMVELSGLCFSKDSSFIWGVGDQGYLYHIDFADNVENMTYTEHYYHDADMEDVTLDPATGDLYIAIEGSQKMYKIPAPNYNTYSTAFYVQEAVDMNIGNSGLEGCTMYKDGKIYIGCQYGANLWTYNLAGEKLSRIQLTTLAPGIEEVGGLCYDAQTDLLWVTDSEAFKLFVFDGAVTKELAEYDISFIGNPESVLVDHKHSCVWVGDDGSSSRLYKIEFSGL